MNSLKEQLGKTFRSIEADLGTTGLLELVLEVIISAAEKFQAQSVDDFYVQFRDLLLMIKSTKPRVGIVLHYLVDIWDEMMLRREAFEDTESILKFLREDIAKAIAEMRSDVDKLINRGVKMVENGDSILVHSHSKVVLRILAGAMAEKKNFRVIVAEQEEEKTADIINFLQQHEIPFYVVPEFMLSHIESEVNKVFLGALTLNDEYYFVADAGTNSVVSEFYNEHIPIYMFLVTKKFALWRGSKTQHRYKIVDSKDGELLGYEKIRFSHDRVSMRICDYVITEQGEFSPDALKELYDKMFEERQRWIEAHVPDLKL